MADRETLDHNLMQLAWEVAQNSNCRRRQVGAVIVQNDVAVVTAANGTYPEIASCNEGVCERCLSDADSGGSYDSCLCIHAEQAAIANAARLAKITQGATLYCTLRPCIPCLNLCLHAGVIRIVYDETIQFPADVEIAYKQLVLGAPIIIIQVRR